MAITKKQRDGQTKAKADIRAAIEKNKQATTAELLADAWAERIRTAIDQSGMTDLDIAKEVTARGISLSPRTIYNWKLNGGMSRDYIDPFCDVVGCDKLWMLTGNKGEPLHIVHSKESLSPGVEQHHMPIPVLETDDLMTDGAMAYESVMDPEVSRATVVDRVDKWIEDPQTATEVYIPFLLNHKHFEENIPGTPRYAVQIIQPDHGEDLHGQLLVFATDVWPNRDDFCLFLRRPIFEVGLLTDLNEEEDRPALWSLHAGFYRSDGWSVPKDADAWWKHAAEKKVNRSFYLQVEKAQRNEDDVVFNFAQHQWCYLGTCVYKMGWVGLDRALAYTRLMERKTQHLRRRARAGEGVFWNF